MERRQTIGGLIEKEVRRRQMSIINFADLIACKRANVYDIFKRNNIYIELLKRISQILHRNLFEDLTKDIDLISNEEETEADILNRKAVSQFLKYIPDILNQLMSFEIKRNSKGAEIEVYTNKFYQTKSCNIKLNFKSENEWYETIKFAFELNFHLNN